MAGATGPALMSLTHGMTVTALVTIPARGQRTVLGLGMGWVTAWETLKV